MIAGPLRLYLKRKKKEATSPVLPPGPSGDSSLVGGHKKKEGEKKRGSMLQATRREKAKQRSERECRRRFRCVDHSLIGSEEKW